MKEQLKYKEQYNEDTSQRSTASPSLRSSVKDPAPPSLLPTIADVVGFMLLCTMLWLVYTGISYVVERWQTTGESMYRSVERKVGEFYGIGKKQLKKDFETLELHSLPRTHGN